MKTMMDKFEVRSKWWGDKTDYWAYTWNRYLARDPPSYDSGIPVSEADAKRMMDKIEARSMWLKANGKAPKILGKQAQVKLCVECVETTKAYKGRQSAYEQHCWQSSSWHSWQSSQT